MNDIVTLYKSEFNEVAYLNGSSDIVVISFSERKEPPPASFFGHSFFSKKSIKTIFIRSLRNSWWLDSDFKKAISEIYDFLKKEKPSRIYGYGFSMGAFGVLKSAETISYDRLILLSPIFSIVPKFDNRWHSDYKEYQTENTKLSVKENFSDLINQAIIYYDPNNKDGEHVKAYKLENNKKIMLIPVFHAGHMTPRFLKHSSSLKECIAFSLEETVNKTKIQNKIREGKRKNIYYLDQLLEKNKNKEKFRKIILKEIRKVKNFDPVVLLTMAKIEAKEKNNSEALKLAKEAINTGEEHFRRNELLAQFAFFYVLNGGEKSSISVLLEDMHSKKPRPRAAQLWFSRYLRISGLLELAFKSHQQFMNGDAFEAHAHQERGIIFESMNLITLAIESYSKAIEFNPQLEHIEKKLKILKGMDDS